ncbi:MAG: hypothetical protein WCT22_02870 [Patescibacteria group bacterium]
MKYSQKANIVTYRNDKGYCYCQIIFQSKEKILISIGSNQVKVFKLLFGFLPTRIIFTDKIHTKEKIEELSKKSWLLFKKDLSKTFKEREKILLNTLIVLAIECLSVNSFLFRLSAVKQIQNLSDLIDSQPYSQNEYDSTIKEIIKNKV